MNPTVHLAFLSDALDRSEVQLRRLHLAQDELRVVDEGLRRCLPSQVVLARIETGRAALELTERSTDLGIAIGDAIRLLLDTPLVGRDAWYARRLVRRNLRELRRWTSRCEGEVATVRRLYHELPESADG